MLSSLSLVSLMSVCCVVTSSVHVDEDVPVDPLLSMFEEQVDLLKNVSRLLKNDVSAINGAIGNVKTGQETLNKNISQRMEDKFSSMKDEINSVGTGQERLVIEKFGEMTRGLDTLKAKQDKLNASVNDIKASLAVIANGVNRVNKLVACPSGYSRSSYNRCYKFDTSHHTWDAAKARCNKDGARLVTIDSQRESDALLQLMKEKIQKNVKCCWFWIGGKHVSGRWVWAESNEEMTFTNWKSGYPKSVSGGKTCANALLQKSESTLYWRNDKLCSNTIGYVICEI